MHITHFFVDTGSWWSHKLHFIVVYSKQRTQFFFGRVGLFACFAVATFTHTEISLYICRSRNIFLCVCNMRGVFPKCHHDQ